MPKLLQTCPLRRATDGDNRIQWFPATDLASLEAIEKECTNNRRGGRRERKTTTYVNNVFQLPRHRGHDSIQSCRHICVVPCCTGLAWWSATWFGLTLIWLFHHLVQQTSQFWQISICPNSTGHSNPAQVTDHQAHLVCKYVYQKLRSKLLRAAVMLRSASSIGGPFSRIV